MRTPALLAVLDGIGLREEREGNAFLQAQAPLLHQLFSEENSAFCSLSASGRDVGLPEGQMGNSEVGHLNIGSGRVVNQELTRIDVAIEEGTFFHNQVLIDTIDSAQENQATLHLLGLLSDGGVHSMQSHLEALLVMATKRGTKRIRVHTLLDGRDVSPQSGALYMRKLCLFIEELSQANHEIDVRVSTVSGRYYAMDRDSRWERVEAAWMAMVLPQYESVLSVSASENAEELIESSYARGIFDEFVEPVALGPDGIEDGDSLIFFNFRPDRARELTRAFIDPDFDTYGFKRAKVPKITFASMTEYDPEFWQRFGAGVVFAKQYPQNTLADYFSSLGLKQLHIAETEKYAHVTFFFNGGIEEPKIGEERILIPSPRVATYDLKPEMSAPEVGRLLAEAIKDDKADVYIVNFANGDMVGHTGCMEAAIKAIGAVDAEVKTILDALRLKQGVALITADHGNSEYMMDEDGNPWTAHTTARVPLAAMDTSTELPLKLKREEGGRLADIAPTLLDLMGLTAPSEFTGSSLLER
ncbi:MAG: 2,3-bisphosphoglycerate-independent phosphoglycerate mutase [Coriobacteriia bacterium]|nr:2,3-bisphosphoglycerate-independent phosphoglycerate mutase [Coriobacteriia bacterium]